MSMKFKSVVVVVAEAKGNFWLINSSGRLTKLVADQNKESIALALFGKKCSEMSFRKPPKDLWTRKARAMTTTHRMRRYRRKTKQKPATVEVMTFEEWSMKAAKSSECKAYRASDGGWLRWAQTVHGNQRKRHEAKNETHRNRQGNTGKFTGDDEATRL